MCPHTKRDPVPDTPAVEVRQAARITSMARGRCDTGNGKNAGTVFDVNTVGTVESPLSLLPLLPLLRALEFGDSMLPVGAFSFSAGLESAVQSGMVKSAVDLCAFTRTALEQAASGDAVAVASAVRAAREGQEAELLLMDAAVLARKIAEENRAMTVRMGKKLLEMASEVISNTHSKSSCQRDSNISNLNSHQHSLQSMTPAQWLVRVKAGESPGTWPVAQGVVFAHLGLSDEVAVAVHQYGLAMTILNASMRLMRVTHLDTQSILYALVAEMPEQCRRAVGTSWKHMAGFAPMNDIWAAQHVTAHVRLFMN